MTPSFNLPYDHKLIAHAKVLRKHMTRSERKLWFEYLRNFNFRVLRQRPIDRYIVDFYCPRLKLVIEIDGESHFTEDGKQYDVERTARLESYGLRVLRFLNTDVMRNLKGVREKIDEVAESPRPSDTPLT